jgi:cleavage and polyadenylation specificity factor subunit 4
MNMLELNEDSLTFDFEQYLPESNKTERKKEATDEKRICRAFQVKGHCRKGEKCPFIHTREKQILCKHWIKGLCKLGDACLYLHEYDLDKMPVCYFFSTHGKNQIINYTPHYLLPLLSSLTNLSYFLCSI